MLTSVSATGIQRVQQYAEILKAPNGERYLAQAYMDRQPGGIWEAWLVFFSLKTGAALATERETTQSTRKHILYWASGLGRTYLQGALERALALRPAARLARRVARAGPQEMAALAEAKVYAAAAAGALRAARDARRRLTSRPRKRSRPAERRPRVRR